MEGRYEGERDGVGCGRGWVARLQAGWRLASSILAHPIPTVRWVGWLMLLLAALTGPWDRLAAGELYPGPPYPKGLMGGMACVALGCFDGPWDWLLAGELYPGPPYPKG